MDKSLFPFQINGWVVGGAIALAGVAAATYSYLSSQRDAKEKAKRRQHFLRLRSSFNSEKNAVIEHVYESPWCQFPLRGVKKMHKAFMAHIASHPDDGRLNRVDFSRVCNKLGVFDEKVIESLFRVWDENGDGLVDFVELAEGLNVMVYGSTKDKLARYFRAFDLDGNGFIDKDELARVYRAFYAGLSDAEVKERAAAFIRLADSSADQRVSHDEFVKLADRPDLDTSSADTFNAQFFREFGVELSMDPTDLNRQPSWAQESVADDSE